MREDKDSLRFTSCCKQVVMSFGTLHIQGLVVAMHGEGIFPMALGILGLLWHRLLETTKHELSLRSLLCCRRLTDWSKLG